jgi:hypothetical protein
MILVLAIGHGKKKVILHLIDSTIQCKMFVISGGPFSLCKMNGHQYAHSIQSVPLAMLDFSRVT